MNDASSGPHGGASQERPGVFDVYGVAISAPLALSAGRELCGTVPDLRVTLGSPRPLPGGDPPGTLVLEAVVDGQRLYVVVRDASGWHLRVLEFGDFDLDPELGTLRCTLDPGADVALLEVLLTGMIPALWLYLKGKVVLHAAAVTLHGETLAFCGRSGMGKSTLASLLCGEGASLVSDDILCVAAEGGHIEWTGRSPELRLRYPAAAHAEQYLPGVPSRLTADGRLAVAASSTSEAHGRLAMVVVPVPTPADSDLSVRRIPPVEALSLLAAFPRLTGWRDPSVLRTQFEGLAALVDGVPVLEAQIPWDLTPDRRLTDRLWPALLTAAGGAH